MSIQTWFSSPGAALAWLAVQGLPWIQQALIKAQARASRRFMTGSDGRACPTMATETRSKIHTTKTSESQLKQRCLKKARYCRNTIEGRTAAFTTLLPHIFTRPFHRSGNTCLHACVGALTPLNKFYRVFKLKSVKMINFSKFIN